MFPSPALSRSFIVEKLAGQDLCAEQVANELKAYLSALGVRPGTMFHIAGYTQTATVWEQTVFSVFPADGPGTSPEFRQSTRRELGRGNRRTSASAQQSDAGSTG